MASGLGVIEIAGGIGLQAHRELVKVLGDLVVVVEVLDKVKLAIAVQVAQAHQLITAGDKQFVAAELHSERLEKSTRKTPPPQRRRRGSHYAVHSPEVAVPCGDDGGFAIGREIKATWSHPALPWIFHRQRESV